MSYEFPIDTALGNGLFPDENMAPNTPFMRNMANARPLGAGVGAVSPEPITSLVEDDDISHPFPMAFRGERTTLLFDADSVQSVGSDLSLSDVTLYDAETPAEDGSITEDGIWQHASADTLWFATNGTTLVFNVPSGEGKVLTSDVPEIGALGMHEHRLFCGGCAGAWFAGERFTALVDAWRETQQANLFAHEDMTFDEGWAIYFEPGGGADDIPYHIALAVLGVFGEDEYDEWLEFINQYIEDDQIGFVPLQRPGAIRAFLPSRAGMAVFGAQGTAMLVPVTTGGYEIAFRGDVGVLGRGSAAGSMEQHWFLDQDRRIRNWMPEQQPRLHFQRRLAGFTSDATLSWDDALGELWLVDGTKSYVLTQHGLGGLMTARPTSLFRDPSNGLVGVAYGAGEDSYTMTLESSVLDILERDYKQGIAVQVQSTGLTDLEARCDYRFDPEDDLEEGSWIPSWIPGYVRVNAAFVDAGVAVRGDYEAATRASVSRLEFRYDATGRNASKGMRGRKRPA